MSDRNSWLNAVLSFGNFPGIGRTLIPKGFTNLLERVTTSLINADNDSENISPDKGTISIPHPQTVEKSINDSILKILLPDCLASQSSSKGENITPLNPAFLDEDISKDLFRRLVNFDVIDKEPILPRVLMPISS